MGEVHTLRGEFPALSTPSSGGVGVYLDSAATTLKPRRVIDAVTRAYEQGIAGAHRATHRWGVAATEALEQTRAEVARWIGAASPAEVVFTRGATESLNLAASGWSRAHLRPGDEVLVSGLEHHASALPWRRACERAGATVVVAPIDASGTVPIESFTRRINPRTRVVVMTHVSNVTGAMLPVRAVASLARSLGALTVVDGAQAVAHVEVDVGRLGCDLYAFSAHKMYGPDGVGVLWGRAEVLDALDPLVVGGGAVSSVSALDVALLPPPHRFEAGTPPLASIVGLGAAVAFLRAHGGVLRDHEATLMAHLDRVLGEVPRLRPLGDGARRVGVASFVLDGVHAHDAGSFLDRAGVAVRAGHHCAQPVMEHFGVSASLRASVGAYNRAEDLDALGDTLRRAVIALG